MQVPPAMVIEAARDDVDKLTTAFRADQIKELHSATGEGDYKFQQGYELGLQTARIIYATSIKAIEAGCNDIL